MKSVKYFISSPFCKAVKGTIYWTGMEAFASDSTFVSNSFKVVGIEYLTLNCNLFIWRVLLFSSGMYFNIDLNSLSQISTRALKLLY